MTELLSTQVFVPLTRQECSKLLPESGKASSSIQRTTFAEVADIAGPDCDGATKLRKVDDDVSQRIKSPSSGGAEGEVAGTRLGDLPRRKAVNIEFRSLTYSVSEGRRKGQFTVLHD